MNVFELFEAKKKSLKNPADNPCWTGYHPVGTKKKAGRAVPNCVPNEGVDEAANAAQQAAIAIAKKKKAGVAEAKHQLQWTVEQHTNGHHNAFYIVRGHDRPREVWKDAQGRSDFKNRAAAEAKATELNQQGMSEGMQTHRDFEKPDDADVLKMAKLAARGLLTYAAKTKMNPVNLLKKDYYALAQMLEKVNPQLYATIDGQLSDNDYNWLYFKAAALAANAAAKQDVAENWGEPLAGWHIVYARTGNKVSGTPDFDSRDSAQKYLMTKMSANHHNYRVADADNLGTSAPTPMGGYLEETDNDDHGYMPTNLKLGAYRDDLNPRDYTPYPDEFKSNEHLREIVYDMVEKGVKPKLVVVSPRRLTATQDWLADERYRDDGSVFEEYADHPVVLTLDGEAYILDGHHRCSGALTANRKIKVYVFGGLVGVAEGEPIQELSSDALDRYKVKAKKSADDLTSQGKYRQANDRTMNVMKATGKQIDNTVTNIRKALNRESTNQGMAEDAEQLNVGDDVIITGDVQFNGATGVIDSFGRDHRFVVVNLYNHGRHSFHSSDVSFNDYADSDDEQARMYDAGEFRGHTDDDVMEGRLQQMRDAGYDIL